MFLESIKYGDGEYTNIFLSLYIHSFSGDITMFYVTGYESKHISKNIGIPLAPNSELFIDVYGGSIQYTITGYSTPIVDLLLRNTTKIIFNTNHVI